MGACSFTSVIATVAAGGLAASASSAFRAASPPRMMPSIVEKSTPAVAATWAGMSTMRLPSTTRPGRGVPPAAGE